LQSAVGGLLNVIELIEVWNVLLSDFKNTVSSPFAPWAGQKPKQNRGDIAELRMSFSTLCTMLQSPRWIIPIRVRSRFVSA